VSVGQCQRGGGRDPVLHRLCVRVAR
jgi:hypothetical protein